MQVQTHSTPLLHYYILLVAFVCSAQGSRGQQRNDVNPRLGIRIRYKQQGWIIWGCIALQPGAVYGISPVARDQQAHDIELATGGCKVQRGASSRVGCCARARAATRFREALDLGSRMRERHVPRQQRPKYVSPSSGGRVARSSGLA